MQVPQPPLCAMTISAVWVRTLAGGAEELVFCSDSRLSGGKRLDQCQKIFKFTRTDAAIGFAGETDWAYPMIVAAVTAAELHLPTLTRALSISKFRLHLLNILNQMQKAVHNFMEDENVPNVTFIYGGYDWCRKRFRVWRIEFSKERRKFISYERYSSNRFGSMGQIEFSGDSIWMQKFREKLKWRLQTGYGMDMGESLGGRFDLEPFEAIRDLLIESTSNDSIGGAPQIVKVYQFMNSADVGVFWPSVANGRLYVSGRPLLEHEQASLKSVLDPDWLSSTWSTGNTAQARLQVNLAIERSQPGGTRNRPLQQLRRGLVSVLRSRPPHAIAQPP